jgi:NitT/TauT family transport system permease protein
MGTSAASAPAPDPGRRTIRGLAASPVAVGAASVLVGLLVWQVGATLFFRPIVLPSVVDIAARAAELLASGDLLQHVQSSYLRILVGFLVGSLVGASLGMLMGMIVHVRRLLEPLVNFFRFVPPIAWLGVVLIWFGVGETSKILIIVYTTSFVVLLSTLAGVLAVPRNQVRAARCLGAGGLQVFRWVMLPASTRYVLTGMQIALTNSFATIVTAEMIAAETGLGHLILVSRNYMATDAIFVGIVTLGALGLLTSRAFATASRRAAWRFFLHG